MSANQQKGEDRNSFIRVIDENRGLIYKVVNAYCEDPTEQQDLVQEVILQLLKGYDRFDHQVKITTWMYRVALNVSISHYRKTSVRRKHFTPLQEGLVEIAGEDTSQLDEDIRMLRHFIQQLDELNRAVMIMYLDGNSHGDIAEVLNISVSNVGTKINRIKEKLKNQFNAIQL